jgi:hypothetical protein
VVEGVAEPGVVVEVVRAEHEGLTLLRSCTVTESSGQRDDGDLVPTTTKELWVVSHE